jgi:hypothetical protein
MNTAPLNIIELPPSPPPDGTNWAQATSRGEKQVRTQ